MQAVRVTHCSDAWAVVVRSRAGWSAAYSGDTRPCPALAAAARGVTVLVHEATFEPALHAQVTLDCCKLVFSPLSLTPRPFTSILRQDSWPRFYQMYRENLTHRVCSEQLPNCLRCRALSVVCMLNFCLFGRPREEGPARVAGGAETAQHHCGGAGSGSLLRRLPHRAHPLQPALPQNPCRPGSRW